MTATTPTRQSTADDTPTADVHIQDLAPDLLKSWLNAGDTVLIDVREDYEHAEERIATAILHPLSKFDAEALRQAHPDKRIVFHCRSGKRSKDAAARFAKAQADNARAFHLAGGIEHWKSTGQPTLRPDTGPRLPIIRQVMLIAGTLVAAGVALGLTLSPWFFALSAFVGLGLMFAGATGWCGMAMLLGRMPWNRRAATACAAQ